MADDQQNLSNHEKLALAAIALLTPALGGAMGGKQGALLGAQQGAAASGAAFKDVAEAEEKQRDAAKAAEAAEKKRLQGIEDAVEIDKRKRQNAPAAAPKTGKYTDKAGNTYEGAIGPDGRIVQDPKVDKIVEHARPDKPPRLQQTTFMGEGGRPLVYDPETGSYSQATAPADVKNPSSAPKDTQVQAATYGRRLEQSEQVFGDLISKGYNRAAYDESALNAVLSGTGLDAIKDANAKRQAQAERNFVNAILRRESGAAIAKEEFSSAEQQYFPRAGDTPDVLAQKKANRDQALVGLRAASGPAWAEVPLVNAVPPEAATGPYGRYVKQGTVEYEWNGTKYVPKKGK